MDEFIRRYAIVGYQMYEKNKSKEELDNSSPFEVICMADDFDRFVQSQK